MLPRLFLTLVALVFLLSAGAKTYAGIPDYKLGGDLYAAFVHNEAWRHYTFVSIEFVLGFWLLSGWRKSGSALATMFLLATLTSLLLAEFFLSAAPKVCGCFANLLADRREEAKTALLWSTARNLFLIGLLAVSLWKSKRPVNAVPHPALTSAAPCGGFFLSQASGKYSSSRPSAV